MPKLRVWHVPQVPMKSFKVEVLSVEEAVKLMDTLAQYDLFQYENQVKPDYCNVSGLQMYDDTLTDQDVLEMELDDKWIDWYHDSDQGYWDNPRQYLEEYKQSSCPAEETKDLDGRMRTAGMRSAAGVVAGQPIDAFVKHSDVIDFTGLLAWVKMRRTELLRMQARYDLGDIEKDDLHEWVVSHVGAFTELHVNLRHVAPQIAALKKSHDQVIEARELYKKSWQQSSLQWMSRSFHEAVVSARKIWLEENDTLDGTDYVTPFDQFLYINNVSGEETDLPGLYELIEWAKYPADGRDLNSVAKGKMSRLILSATGLGEAFLSTSD